MLIRGPVSGHLYEWNPEGGTRVIVFDGGREIDRFVADLTDTRSRAQSEIVAAICDRDRAAGAAA